MTFVGANPSARVVGDGPLQSRSNYFKGDPSQWLTNVPNYSAVVVHDIYPGIDVRYYGNNSGLLEYDLVVKPGADPSQIRLDYQGVTGVSIDPRGAAHLSTPNGEIRSWEPVAYQVGETGARREASARYLSLGTNQFGFQVSQYDHSAELVIDPAIDYSTFLGRVSDDEANGIAVDNAGAVYVAGSSYLWSNYDAFVTKLSADGRQVVYSVYIGGSADDWANAIAVDPAGNAYVAGYSAAGFPVTPGTPSAILDPVVFKLNATGDQLLYARAIGTYNSAPEEGTGIAVNAQGEAFLVGFVQPESWCPFPTTDGVYQHDANGGLEAFLTKLSPSGGTIYSTLLGGPGDDRAYGVAVDQDGYAYVTGEASSGFPTTGGAYQETVLGGTDAFVTKFNKDGTARVYSTVIGGRDDDASYGIALDSSGNAYITGEAGPPGLDAFPTPGGFQTSFGGGDSDAFVTAISYWGSSLISSSLLGGSGADSGRGIALDASRRPLLTGMTTSSDFPTLSAFQPSFGGVKDAFVTQVSADGHSKVFSSYLGGSDADEGRGIGLDILDNAYIAGMTVSTDFPTQDPYQANLAGSSDAFVTKITLQPDPPAITSISTDSGASASDFITNDQTLVISGTALASSTVDIYRPGTVDSIGTVTADASGAWAFDYTGTTLAGGTYGFYATATSDGFVSQLSRTTLVTVDLTPPTVTLKAPSATASLAPEIEVWASDLVGFAPGATVSIDADRNGDSDFDDPGEIGYATAALADGYVRITLPSFSGTGAYHLRARVSDLAGNEGTSAAANITITPATTWGLAGAAMVNHPGEGNAGELLGVVTLAHALDLDLSPGSSQAGAPSFVYNGATVSARPVIQGVVTTPNNVSLPATLDVELVWDGASQGVNTYGATGIAPGDLITVSARPNAPVSTGRHTWELRVKITGLPDLVATGTTFAVDQSASPFGAGWNLSILNRLIDVPASGSDPAGRLWLYGTGDWRFFAGSSGTFSSPADDNGVLVKNQDGSFTYTTPEQDKIEFDSEGFQTQWTSADAHATLHFAHAAGLLTGLTAIDGSASTFNYSSGKLTSILAPGSRTFTTTIDTNGDLTSIQNPDDGVHSFTYSNHRITSETFGLIANQWHYDSGDVLDQQTWGAPGSPSVFDISPAATHGLGGLAKGSPTATVTDPLGYATLYAFDSYSRLIKQVEANGATTTWTRDGAGRVTEIKDPLGRSTAFERDTKGYVTQETFPDAETQHWSYDSTYHGVTSFTDERGNTTIYVYDPATGHLQSTTDALLNQTSYAYSLTTGLLETSTDPQGKVTSFVYDTYRRQTQAKTTYSLTVLAQTDTAYDSWGNPSSDIDALGLSTAYLFDAMGRKTFEQVGTNGAQTWVYDDSGLVTETQNQNLHRTQLIYDESGRGIAHGDCTAAVQARLRKPRSRTGRETEGSPHTHAGDALANAAATLSWPRNRADPLRE